MIDANIHVFLCCIQLGFSQIYLIYSICLMITITDDFSITSANLYLSCVTILSTAVSKGL